MRIENNCSFSFKFTSVKNMDRYQKNCCHIENSICKGAQNDLQADRVIQYHGLPDVEFFQIRKKVIEKISEIFFKGFYQFIFELIEGPDDMPYEIEDNREN